ncbi:MAG TPA: spermidine synthase, partial [Candidatus Dormibacteraeota bacterium]|nr:spermidine synthase [Candidatus Dormibacteraeota bacterium]
GNFVAVASAGELPLASLSQRIAERGTPVKVAGRDATRRFAAGSPVLRDDYAPVDQLITRQAR